jgi:hypothetical protein
MYYYCVMKQSFELNDTIKQLTTIKINNDILPRLKNVGFLF